ncbi:hypothetical protein F0L74_11685 [Chitinophaga agrisoli]|uniref:Uncharacterized protein n=1 Tax=Chitinophaga agrisoli TaxID=2607653 RepID=A0A5B2VYV0_9BACT|nr:hypothetical protein [Chitinophaga agrisoli]KAA2243169.1 hypothetical protein F0L74_11685 [Chitinophaga agrisoli]
MRTLLRVTMDVMAGNNAIKNGSLARIMKATMDRLQPEASYFLPIDGCRACLMVFDLKDPAMIPSISEPFFLELNAKVEMCPVMNADDLREGLALFDKAMHEEEPAEMHA